MVIDFHTHCFPPAIAPRAIETLSAGSHTVPFSDGTDAGLGRSMHAAGVDYSVALTVATNPDKVTSINNGLTAETDDGLVRFGCIHPAMTDWKREIDRLAERGIRGIKLHPVFQNTDLDDDRYLRIIAHAAERGLIVITHAGADIGFPGVVRCTPTMAARVLRTVGPVTLVLAHMGGWRNWQEALEVLPGTGAYIDTSFSLGCLTPKDGYYTDEQCRLLAPDAAAALIRAIGAKRVLFGSDSPWDAQAAARRAVEELPLTAAEKAAILGENAARLLHL